MRVSLDEIRFKITRHFHIFPTFTNSQLQTSAHKKKSWSPSVVRVLSFYCHCSLCVFFSYSHSCCLFIDTLSCIMNVHNNAAFVVNIRTSLLTSDNRFENNKIFTIYWYFNYVIDLIWFLDIYTHMCILSESLSLFFLYLPVSHLNWISSVFFVTHTQIDNVGICATLNIDE